MTTRKQRLTVTVDPELVEAGNLAVSTGQADSLSAWVNLALAERAERDARLSALSAAVANYELEFGEITTDEIVTQRRTDRESATVVRGKPTGARRQRRTSAPGAA